MNLLWKRIANFSISQLLRIQSGCNILIENRFVPVGAAKVLDKLQHAEKIMVLDTAAGSVSQLPPATGSGTKFAFMVSVQSVSHVIKVGNVIDVINGTLVIANNSTPGSVGAFEPAPTDDTISLNGTTTSGRIGDYFELLDLKAGFWILRGQMTTTGAAATPFSATV